MQNLEKYRHEIDCIDVDIVRAFAKRTRVCEKVARFKREHDIPMMQPERVAAVLARCATLASQHGIDPAFVARIYAIVIEESCRVESDIMGSP
jgi:chorismate mutase-like protein